MEKTIFSGVQPSGNLHIGNYLGALSQWAKMQNGSEAIFCIVDLHAITVSQDSKVLREKILDTAALYIACGIDPVKSHIFVQSENPNHANLAWILNTITPFGQLERMTQFKEKSEKHGENVGLFDYPVLMAADILLYGTDEVPVGEDQKQHLELARDLAGKFNSKFGSIFKLPKPFISAQSARIMSLTDPTRKMSKSDNDPMGTINLLDSEEEIREKIKKAVTDSGSHISYDYGSEAISNLISIYSSFKDQDLKESLKELEGKSYGEFKSILADLVVSKLSEIQNKYQEIRNDSNSLSMVLDDGRDYSIEKSNEIMRKVREAVGLGR